MNAKTECFKMHVRFDFSLEKSFFFFSVGRPTVFGVPNASEKKNWPFFELFVEKKSF